MSKTMKRYLGVTLLFTPFVGLLIWIIKEAGWLGTLTVVGGTTLVLAMIVGGVALIESAERMK
jgi:hypothetical protein